MSRYISRCKKCGIVEAIDVVGFTKTRYRNAWLDGYLRQDPSQPYQARDEAGELRQLPEGFRGMCKCGRYRRVSRVEGHMVATVPCNAKCTGAFGPSCDCSCGGKNHGAGHVIQRIDKEVPVAIPAVV